MHSCLTAVLQQNQHRISLCFTIISLVCNHTATLCPMAHLHNTKWSYSDTIMMHILPSDLANNSIVTGPLCLGDLLFGTTVTPVTSLGSFNVGYLSALSRRLTELSKCSLHTRVFSFKGRAFRPILWTYTFNKALFLSGRRWNDLD